MILLLLFLCGIANVAANRAVIESGHPGVDMLPAILRADGGRVCVMAEFCLLLIAMLVSIRHPAAAGWTYAIYTVATQIALWSVITRRV